MNQAGFQNKKVRAANLNAEGEGSDPSLLSQTSILEVDKKEVLTELTKVLVDPSSVNDSQALSAHVRELLERNQDDQDFVSDLIEASSELLKQTASSQSPLKDLLLNYLSEEGTPSQILDKASTALQGMDCPEVVKALILNIENFHEPHQLSLVVANVLALKGTRYDAARKYLRELATSSPVEEVSQAAFEALVPHGDVKTRNFLLRQAVERPELAWKGLPNLQAERDPLTTRLLIQLLKSESPGVRRGAALALYGIEEHESEIVAMLVSEAQQEKTHPFAQAVAVILQNANCEAAQKALDVMGRFAKSFDLRRASRRVTAA